MPSRISIPRWLSISFRCTIYILEKAQTHPIWKHTVIFFLHISLAKWCCHPTWARNLDSIPDFSLSFTMHISVICIWCLHSTFLSSLCLRLDSSVARKRDSIKMDYLKEVCCKIMPDNCTGTQRDDRTQMAVMRIVAGTGNSRTEDALSLPLFLSHSKSPWFRSSPSFKITYSMKLSLSPHMSITGTSSVWLQHLFGMTLDQYCSVYHSDSQYLCTCLAYSPSFLRTVSSLRAWMCAVHLCIPQNLW